MRGKQRYTSNPPARRPPPKVSTDSNKSRRLKKLRANAALNLRQNSELPVAKLPVEILLQIFYEYIFHGAIEIGISRRYDVDDRLDKRNCRWLTIIQICHHWRNIVLSVPVLWSYITDDICYYPHLLEMALSRSAETLLDVEIHWVTEPAHTTTVAMLTRLFKKSRRIRRLYLHLPAHKVAAVTLSATAPFTCLEDLEISNPRELPPDPPYLAFIMISRPPTHPLVPLVTRILEEDRPPLKIAVFNDIVIPPHLLSYLPSTLTHLILNDSSTPPYSNDGIRVTNLDFLRKLEKLEILHLGPVETHMRDDIVTFGTTKLVLPHLKQLSISGEQSSMLGLLHWITLPSTTRLHIQTLRDSGPHLDFCTTILSMIHQRIDYQQVQCIIDFEEEVKFAICALGDDHRRCPYGLNYRRILSSNSVIHCNHCYISLELSHRTWQHIEDIPSMKVILSNLKALYLLIPHHLVAPQLERGLTNLLSLTENVEVLKIKETSFWREDPSPVCYAITKVLRVVPDSDCIVLVPKLKTLELSDVFDPDHSARESICASLETRQASEGKLGVLTLLGGYFTRPVSYRFTLSI